MTIRPEDKNTDNNERKYTKSNAELEYEKGHRTIQFIMIWDGGTIEKWLNPSKIVARAVT